MIKYPWLRMNLVLDTTLDDYPSLFVKIQVSYALFEEWRQVFSVLRFSLQYIQLYSVLQALYLHNSAFWLTSKLC